MNNITLNSAELTSTIRAIGTTLTAKIASDNKATESRHVLACYLQDAQANLEVNEQADLIKKTCMQIYPKAYGDAAARCPKQVAKVQATRVVVATYKKARTMSLSPNEFDSYAAWRTEVYATVPLTKAQQIAKWLKDDKVTLAEVQATVDAYKALPKA